MYFYIGGVVFILVTIWIQLYPLKDVEKLSPIEIIIYLSKHPLTYLVIIGGAWAITGLFGDQWPLFLSIIIVRLVYLFTPVSEKIERIAHISSSIIEINIAALILYLNYSNY